MYVIDVSEPSSFDGCRGPNDILQISAMPCESCYIQDGKNCFKKFTTDGADWYNGHRNLWNETCANNYPKCASCLFRDEDQLMSLKPPEQCDPTDCKTMEIGVDPCFAMSSCECFCLKANFLIEKCPDVKPDWLSG